MSSVSSLLGIFQELFTPLPESQATTCTKDHVDHVADYADSAAGAWDVFRVIDNTLSYIKMLPSLAPHWLSVIEKVKNVASTAGIGLSIPKIIVDTNTLRRSLTHLFKVQDLPYSDSLRTRKIAQAFKKSFLDTLDLTWTVSQAALFVDNAKIYVFEAANLRIIDGVNNAASVISDSADLISEYFKLQQYYSPEAQAHLRNSEESVKLEQKKRLSWINVAKDVASIGGSAIALVGIVFGIVVQSIPIITGAALVLSTIWLTMKLVSYFYNKIVVEAPIVPLSRQLVI
jgi:hypothetical protein